MTGVITPVIPDELYQIDPATGQTTAIGPTTFALDAITDIGGTIYGFKNNTGQLVTLDLSNGNTSVIGDVDPNAGLIFGAAPVPEPASIALVLGALAALTLRRISSAPKARAADRCP